MAFFTLVNGSTGMIEQSLNWFSEYGSPPVSSIPIIGGSPPSKRWIPDNPPSPTRYQKVERVEPVPSDADEIQYIITPISLENAKELKHNEIDILRNTHMHTPILYDGNTYDADESSRFNLVSIISAVQAGIPLPTGFTWRTADNQNVPHDSTTLIGLAAVMLVQVNTVYNASWVHKNAVDALSTTEEIEAYDHTVNWTV